MIQLSEQCINSIAIPRLWDRLTEHWGLLRRLMRGHIGRLAAYLFHKLSRVYDILSHDIYFPGPYPTTFYFPDP